jgi:CHAT domain-containing protein
VGRDPTYLFAATRTQLQVYPIHIQERELRQRVGDCLRLLSNPEAGGFRKDAAGLYRLLVAPAQRAVDAAARVLICPDGPLHRLPFAALVTDGAGRYFVERKALHTVASVSLYAELRRQAAARAGKRRYAMLGFGDPAYEGAGAPPQAAAARIGSTRGPRLQRLPATRQEVLAIAKLYGKEARVHLGRDASATAAQRESGDAAVVFFACHALLDNRDPLASALALSPERTRRDGLLRAYDVMQHLRLNADLVALGACSTGLGQEMRGEGIVGLARAFQYAGARTVLVTQWEILDTSTTPLMLEFTRQLKNGVTKDEALRRGQRRLMKDGEHAHPFYWAPFVLVGDWR